MKKLLAVLFCLLAARAGAQSYDAQGRLMVSANFFKLGGTTLSGANVVDVGNTAFRVNCVTGCTAGGSFSDSTAFTFGTTAVGLSAFVVDDTSTNTVAENSAGAARMSASRILFVDISKTTANATAIKVDGSAVTQPVSGTFWQATQPVSGTFWQATQPISGTVTANAGSGTFAVSGTFWQATQPVSIATMPSTPVTGTFWPTTAAAPASHRLSDGAAFYDATKTGQLPAALVSGRLDVNIGASSATVPVSGPLTDTQLRATPVPVSGTVTTTPPANASTNVAQIGATTVVTGGVAGTLGVGGLAASGATKVGNPQQIGGVFNTTPPTVTNGQMVEQQMTARGEQHTILRDAAGNLRGANVTAGNAVQVDLTSILGSAFVTAATGVQKVGVVGNANAALDAANNAAAPANVLVSGFEARSSGPTQLTNGNVGRATVDLAGNLHTVAPLKFTCALDNIAATLTQCQAVAAAGYSYYITTVFANSTTATAATFAIRSGTGSNCATGTAGVLPGASTSRTYVLPANTAAPFQYSNVVGIKVTAAHAICAIGAATNTLNITISGYTAP